MDILVTYEDGTTELRAANSYVHWADAWRLKACGITRQDRVAAGRGRYLKLSEERNRREVTVWRITGGRDKGEPLTGEWAACRVESVDEQIARLTRKRDATEKRAARWKHAAKRLWWVLRGAEQDIGHLRRGARAMIGALRPGEFNDWKPSSLAADLVVWAEYVAGLSARADAAEKRLADLRAWAEREARRAHGLLLGPRAAVFDEMLRRIDGKEDGQ